MAEDNIAKAACWTAFVLVLALGTLLTYQMRNVFRNVTTIEDKNETIDQNVRLSESLQKITKAKL